MDEPINSAFSQGTGGFGQTDSGRTQVDSIVGELPPDDLFAELKELRHKVIDLTREVGRRRFKKIEEKSEEERIVGREISLVHTRLQEAHLWIGEALFHLSRRKGGQNASRF